MFKVSIVGKPNVGKSTLFNRIILKKQSIVSDKPGVTRDRIYAQASWVNKNFMIADTGGLTNKNAVFQYNIENQVLFAINEANLILFVVSEKDGIDKDDYYVAKLLKKNKAKNVILVVNKCENKTGEYERLYYSLGFGKPIYISAEHSIGIGDLLDLIIKSAPNESKAEQERTRFCVIGRPNVGKSTLVNTILNQDRVIVSNVAGTTRDSIDCDFKFNNKLYTIIDTAGIRKKSKMSDEIEKFALTRTEDSISRSKLILLMLDGSEEFNEQDETIGGLAFKANIPTIIVVNKWDKVSDKESNTMNKFIKKIRAKFHYLVWAPIVFISSLQKQRVNKIFDTIEIINAELSKTVNTSALNDVLSKAEILNPPPKFKGNRFNFSYATQVKSQIPTFVIFGNDPKYVHFSYARYLENQIRNSFGFYNTPITLYFKDKNSRIRGIKKDR